MKEIRIYEVIEMDEEKDRKFKGEMSISFDDEKDVEEFKEVMNTLRETIPALIREIVEALYSTQNAEEFAGQVANFYKKMIDAGMDKEQAFQLTQEFMRTRDITSLVNRIISEREISYGKGNKEEKSEGE